MFGAFGKWAAARNRRAAVCLVILMPAATAAWAVDVVPNGIFTSDLSSWTPTYLQSDGSVAWDSAVGDKNPGSMRFQTVTGRDLILEAEAVTSLTATINSDDFVNLSFYWFKITDLMAPRSDLVRIYAVLPAGGGDVLLWSNADIPAVGTPIEGNENIDVSSYFTVTGDYQLKVYGLIQNNNNRNSTSQFNLDDIVLDVTSSANSAPTVVAGATQASLSPVNRIGTESTTISTTFLDADAPGVAAFNVSFRVREPDNATELILVNNQANGAGGLTISDGGGGSYTASYSYNPDDAQNLGLYDLEFEVSDGTDSVVDAYAANADELEINEVIANNAPVVSSGATQVSVSPVNRLGSGSTTISTDFTDADAPNIGDFQVTMRIREPDDLTLVTLVINEVHGSGGLTIVDNGGGSYTASYTYDPIDTQTLGLYDLYFLVSDGIDNAIDTLPSNTDELEINEVLANNAPVVAAGATQVSLSPVNRFGSESTVISTTFSDADAPGVGAFTATFRIRAPNNVTEIVLVNNAANGVGGLSISDDGGGAYTASYTYNPNDAQTIGLYDLTFEVSDGSDGGIDDYTDNLDELEIHEILPNSVPVIVAGATQASVSPVNRLGAFTTVISTTFSDADAPVPGSFLVTFRIREPNNSTELTLVNNLSHGSGGLTVTDLGGGSYTASYTYNPDDAQAIGLYDLYCEVSDGSDSAVDNYTDNLNELEINSVIVNNPPVVATGAMTALPTSVDRVGAVATEISIPFSDGDSPGAAAFQVTIHLREPLDQGTIVLASALQNGTGGLTITDDGGGDYTARISWDPADNALVGYYDLYCLISDGEDQGEDLFDNNPDELLITNGGENSSPVVPSDNVYATPAGVQRVGVYPTTLTARFLDPDMPGASAFAVTFKVRLPDNTTELTLANAVGDGTGGVTISDDGGGVYTARLDWDAGDTADLGFYDLYFLVSDGSASAVDGFLDNQDELELFDPLLNTPVTIVSGATLVQPVSITRSGTDFTMIQCVFHDDDMPGPGGFLVDVRVRDAATTEYPLVTIARDGEQGLRIKPLGGGDYEASVLWDPPIGQVAGLYDLYFSVTDAGPSTATDDFTANADELTVTADPVLGDGYLLRRSHDANACGGPNAACHNIEDHQGQTCLTCHVPHGSPNIYLIGETIETPNSGTKSVVFKTLGIGDPYNDPDPVVGDPTSGVPGDDSDGVFTGVCEVCHTATSHHRNDASAPVPGHYNAEDCTSCHSHSGGFSGGEGGGGGGCACHNNILIPMQTEGPNYHHTMDSDNGSYGAGENNCLMCHVNHDIFRPDMNPGIGTRAKNLRSHFQAVPVIGDPAVLADSDYSAAGGGICLSCHAGACSNCHTVHKSEKASTFDHKFLLQAGYDAITSTHNYEVQSIYKTDLSAFKANCSKCHNDELAKTYQEAGNQFGTHDTEYGYLLSPLGDATPGDPLEEKICYQCHSVSENPNSGSNLDYYGVQPMSDASMDVAPTLDYTYAHPVNTINGLHLTGEDAADLADGNRHAECGDCHNVHETDQGTHDGSTSLVSNALKGVWGVTPAAWPAAPTPADNVNLYATPASYNKVQPAVYEWQICLKCHSGYTTLPAGSPDLGQEINPNYVSQHGIAAAGTNAYCNTSTMNEPWASSHVTYCSDCHRSNNSADPQGAHGSNLEHMLVATVTSDNSVGTPLCYVCHQQNVYWSGPASASRFGTHPGSRSAHKVAEGCFGCHMWEFSTASGLGVNTVRDLSMGKIHVHGMNKRFVYNEQNGGAGSGQMADAFVDGFMENMDYTAKTCWSATCRTHSGIAY
jgi:hypothetical protein